MDKPGTISDALQSVGIDDCIASLTVRSIGRLRATKVGAWPQRLDCVILRLTQSVHKGFHARVVKFLAMANEKAQKAVEMNYFLGPSFCVNVSRMRR